MKSAGITIFIFLIAGLFASFTSVENASASALTPLQPSPPHDVELPWLVRSFVPRPNPVQAKLLSDLDKQKVDSGGLSLAAKEWPAAFGATRFGLSDNGQAVYKLILFKAGVPLYAVQALLATVDPGKLKSRVKLAWKQTSAEAAVSWDLVDPALWKSSWTPVFGAEAENQVRIHQVFSAVDLPKLKALLAVTPENSQAHTWLEWQKLLLEASQPKAGVLEAKQAAADLGKLLKSNRLPVNKNLVSLTAGRLLYQAGLTDPAISYYEQVAKGSNEWFAAQEELGWAQLRKGEPQNTLAITKTLLTPVFEPFVSPQSFYLRALALLKVCDYPAVDQTLELFRKEFRPRVIPLSKLAHESLAQFPESRKALLPPAYPRAAADDDIILRNIGIRRELLAEQKAHPQFQSLLDAPIALSESNLTNEMHALASDELTELSQTLQQMHIVDVEILQQSAVFPVLAKKAAASGTPAQRIVKSGTTGSRDRDRIQFPDEGEVWFDELASYRVDLKKGCQLRSVKR